jgi:hypothetical protein
MWMSVHQDEIGRKLSYLGECVAAVADLADDLKVGLGFEDHPQSAADECFVVGDARTHRQPRDRDNGEHVPF